MKKVTGTLLLLIASCQLFSQAMPSVADSVIKTDYLKKSKKQRTAGTICTTAGAVLMVTGSMILISNAMDDMTTSFSNFAGGWGAFGGVAYTPIPYKKHTNAGAIITVTGTALLVTGITYLVIAKNNKKKALVLTIKNEQIRRLHANMLVNTIVPSIGLRWQFGNR